MNKKESTRLAQTFAADCIAFRVRVLNRVITNLYDSVLKPLGIDKMIGNDFDTGLTNLKALVESK